MSDTTRLDLDAIEARRLDAAEAIDEGDLVTIRRGATTRIVRDDVPALVARVRELEATIQRVRDLRHEWAGLGFRDVPWSAIEGALDGGPGTEEADRGVWTQKEVEDINRRARERYERIQRLTEEADRG